MTRLSYQPQPAAIHLPILWTLQGQASHALWVSWALMEARQGDATAVRYLFKRCLDVGPRSRCVSYDGGTYVDSMHNVDRQSYEDNPCCRIHPM